MRARSARRTTPSASRLVWLALRRQRMRDVDRRTLARRLRPDRDAHPSRGRRRVDGRRARTRLAALARTAGVDLDPPPVLPQTPETMASSTEPRHPAFDAAPRDAGPDNAAAPYAAVPHAVASQHRPRAVARRRARTRRYRQSPSRRGACAAHDRAPACLRGARASLPRHHRLRSLHLVHRPRQRNAAPTSPGAAGAVDHDPRAGPRHRQRHRHVCRSTSPASSATRSRPRRPAIAARRRACGRRRSSRIWSSSRLLHAARGASGCARSPSRPSRSTASSRRQPTASTAAASPRTSCWSCRWRCATPSSSSPQRELAIDRARWALNQAHRRCRSTRRPSVVDVRDAPDAAAGERRRCARPIASNPVAGRAGRGAAAARGDARPRSRAAACRASRAAARSTTRAPTIVEPQAIGSGFVGFSWDLGTDTRREAQIAEARIAADRNRIAHRARAARARAGGARHAPRRRGAARRARHRARPPSARPRRTCASASSSSTPAARPARTCSTPRRCSPRSAPRSRRALYQAHTRRAELQQLMGLPLDDARSPEAR